MRKLKLEIADLEVTSFAAAAEGDRARGTVAGRLHQQAVTQNVADITCGGEVTCPTCYTCPGTCAGDLCGS